MGRRNCNPKRDKKLFTSQNAWAAKQYPADEGFGCVVIVAAAVVESASKE